MKFAILSSISKPTQPNAAGGIEVWTANFLLAEGKQKRILDLYALKNSLNHPPLINLIEVNDKGIDGFKQEKFFLKSINKERDSSFFSTILKEKALLLLKKHEDQYDLIIDSSGDSTISLHGYFYKQPILVIGHFPVEFRNLYFFNFFPIPKNVSFVFPSSYQYNKAFWIAKEKKYFIPHGIKVSKFAYSKINKINSLVWISRIDRNKGLPIAINLAKKLKIPLTVYGNIEDVNYFNLEIKPLFLV